MVTKDKINDVLVDILKRYSKKHYSEPSHPSDVVFIERLDDESIDDIFKGIEDILTDVDDVRDVDINDRGLKTKEGLDVYSLSEIGRNITEAHPNLTIKEINDKRFSLIDEEYDVELQLGSFIKRQDLIDFTSNGKGKLDLSEFIEMYDAMPDKMKYDTGMIRLDNHNGEKCNNRYYDGGSDKYGVVTLTPDMFIFSEKNGGVVRVIAHEMFHSTDVQYRMNDEEKRVWKKYYTDKENLTGEEHTILDNAHEKIKGSRISESDAWKYQLLKDNYHQERDLGLPQQHPSAYGSNYARHNGGSCVEDYADVGSMVALSGTKYGGGSIYSHDVNAHFNPLSAYPIGESINEEEFIRRNPNQCETAKGLLEGRIKLSSNGYNFVGVDEVEEE